MGCGIACPFNPNKRAINKGINGCWYEAFSGPGNLVSSRNQTPFFWGHSSAGFNGLEEHGLEGHVVSPKVLISINQFKNETVTRDF